MTDRERASFDATRHVAGGGSAAAISPRQLRDRLIDTSELALLDLRETGVHSRDGHILLGVTLPLSQLELRIRHLVPRATTPIVVYDAGDGVLAQRGAERLFALGYSEVAILAGGAAAWQAAGYELFTGVHVVGKAFGEFVEHAYGTPHLSVREVKAALDRGDNLVVLDSRPEAEFKTFSIPGAIDLPGAELVYRFQEAVPDPQTLVVVNCAGRTRSIIGAQALINAGVPNRVASLANGTMDWLIEGYALDTGRSRLPPRPSGAALDAAKEAASRLTARFGLRHIDADALRRFEADETRTLHVLDVRGEDEFADGHRPGSVWAPGGQLVQQVGHWVGTRNGRIVLVDEPDGTRAAITASWLVQINWGEVYILDGALEGRLETGPAVPPVAGEIPAVEAIAASDLRAAIEAGSATLIDVGPSLAYEAGHVPGAHYAIRSRLADDAATLPGSGLLVLTSEDGRLAAFAARDLGAATSRPIRVLDGGTRAWRDAGLPLETGPSALLHPTEDAWRSPYQRGGRHEAFQEYLDWELGLVAQLERDGTARFHLFPVDGEQGRTEAA